MSLSFWEFSSFVSIKGRRALSPSEKQQHGLLRAHCAGMSIHLPLPSIHSAPTGSHTCFIWQPSGYANAAITQSHNAPAFSLTRSLFRRRAQRAHQMIGGYKDDPGTPLRKKRRKTRKVARSRITLFNISITYWFFKAALLQGRAEPLPRPNEPCRGSTMPLPKRNSVQGGISLGSIRIRTSEGATSRKGAPPLQVLPRATAGDLPGQGVPPAFRIRMIILALVLRIASRAALLQGWPQHPRALLPKESRRLSLVAQAKANLAKCVALPCTARGRSTAHHQTLLILLWRSAMR
jgi:hypothetical protein